MARLTPEQTHAVLRRYASGETSRSIAADFGMQASGVRDIAHRHGVRAARHDDTLPKFPFQPEPWTEHGLCAQTDPEAFFSIEKAVLTEVRDVCRRCPVAAECLNYAMRNREQYGIWGGRTPRERRHLEQVSA